MTSNSEKIYLVAGARTPFGSFGGSLQKITPVDLSVIASNKILNDTKVKAEKIDQVILGNVCPSSTDTLYGARHLALKIGCDLATPGYVLNRLCGSGIQAMIDAYQNLKLGRANCILAGGVENMSMIPHLVYGGRFGTKYGSLKSVDMLLDALTDKYSDTPMGITAENLAQKYNLNREECDIFSMNSHKKAAYAYEKNWLQGEIAPVEEGRVSLCVDEHLRKDVSVEQMNKLKPSFKKDGVVTPATASGIVDGAAMSLIATESFCEKNGITPLAELVDYAVVGVDPSIMGIGPVPAIKEVLDRASLSLGDMDLIEINEAFAAQTISCIKELELPEEKLNIWGGAIALGHPLAASGTRIALTLARQLNENGLKQGIASACIGGGQGIAMLIKSL